MLEEIIPLVVVYWPTCLLALFLIYCLSQRYQRGLAQYPGPFLASFTDWWRLYDTYRRQPHYTYQQLHAKHGDVVRVGPSMLSFAEPAAIKDIYGLNKGFVKSDYYKVQAATNRGQPVYNLFSSVDEAYHARLRRSVNHAFAMTTLLGYEPLVDSTIALYLQRTRELWVGTGEALDFSRWLQYLAFDVIGEITWSKRLGFIEQNADIQDIIHTVDGFLDHGSVIGQNPWLDHLGSKNPVKLWLESVGLFRSGSAIADFALARQRERVAVLNEAKGGPDGDAQDLLTQGKGVDFLTRLMQTQRDDPQFMTDHRLLSICLSLIIAGSDSTAISLGAVFYFLLRNPTVYEKLMTELDNAATAGQLYGSTEGVVPFSRAQKLPYLDACITESFRCFPAVGFVLERIVPSGGVVIAGRHVPGGTNVGCNAWVLHQRREIFGEDADTFRPERWLESEGADPSTIKEMRATMFQFGAGSRTCIGKNISLMETYKLVPSFLRQFEIEFADPAKDITSSCSFFVRMYDFKVRIRAREKR